MGGLRGGHVLALGGALGKKSAPGRLRSGVGGGAPSGAGGLPGSGMGGFWLARHREGAHWAPSAGRTGRYPATPYPGAGAAPPPRTYKKENRRAGAVAA